jgi:hypothetical protein
MVREQVPALVVRLLTTRKSGLMSRRSPARLFSWVANEAARQGNIAFAKIEGNRKRSPGSTIFKV